MPLGSSSEAPVIRPGHDLKQLRALPLLYAIRRKTIHECLALRQGFRESLIDPAMFCALPSACSALPSSCSLASPTSLPMVSLTEPLICLPTPTMRFLSMIPISRWWCGRMGAPVQGMFVRAEVGPAYGAFLFALRSMAWPVLEISSPAPAVAWQAPSSGMAPRSASKVRANIVLLDMMFTFDWAVSGGIVE